MPFKSMTTAALFQPMSRNAVCHLAQLRGRDSVPVTQYTVSKHCPGWGCKRETPRLLAVKVMHSTQEEQDQAKTCIV